MIIHTFHHVLGSGSHCRIDLAIACTAAAASCLLKICWCSLQGSQNQLHDLQVDTHELLSLAYNLPWLDTRAMNSSHAPVSCTHAAMLGRTLSPPPPAPIETNEHQQVYPQAATTTATVIHSKVDTGTSPYISMVQASRLPWLGAYALQMHWAQRWVLLQITGIYSPD